MQRGTLVLTKKEVEYLFKEMTFNNSSNELLAGKIKDAFESGKESNNILLSEEDLENILDTVGQSEKEIFSKTSLLLRDIRGLK